MKRLITRHEKQIKLRFLAVAEEQIFADGSAEQLFHRGAGLDRGRFVVVGAPGGHAELVEEIITRGFDRVASGAVRRTAFVQGGVKGKVIHHENSFMVF